MTRLRKRRLCLCDPCRQRNPRGRIVSHASFFRHNPPRNDADQMPDSDMADNGIPALSDIGNTLQPISLQKQDDHPIYSGSTICVQQVGQQFVSCTTHATMRMTCSLNIVNVMYVVAASNTED